MLPQSHKISPITTDQSWYTPNKHKNVSAIETNPSMNVIQSHQYSSIELSESLAQSPSFLSPNKQLGSFLMTPNYSSKQMLPSGSESIGDMRLRTQSLVETSRFYELTGESKKTESGASSHEVKELIKMINEIRQIRAKKTYHSRKLNEQMAIQLILVKKISQKEQNIFAHKLTVEEKIQQKNKLQKKLKQKKAKIKAKTKNFLHELEAKVNKLRQELDVTCNILNLDQMAIGRYQNQLYQINTYMQKQGYETKPPYLMHQNQGENYMLQSKAQQLNYQQIPGFYSNPSSSRSHQTNMKKSSEEIHKSGQQKSANSSNLSIEGILKNHFSSMMGNGQANQQKLRKFSFGQNPSFSMGGLENNKHGSGKKRPQQNENRNVLGNNVNFIMEALAMRVNQLAGNNPHQNPQSISPQKRFNQNPGPFITQQFDNISPIASAKRIKFRNDIAQLQIKQVFSKNHNLSNNKKDFNQIIEQLESKQQQDESQCQIQYYNQSVIDINEDPMIESKYKNSPRLNFNRKQFQSPQHNRSPSGQTGKKSIKLPLVLQQSIVQIACQSSTCSDNLQRHDFSPRKQEMVERRLRSPTHQVMPAIHEEMHHDLRKTENRLKGSNKEAGSSKHSGGGAQTPIFRSEASEEQQNLGFSRPFLGGSMKESQILDEKPHQFEQNNSIINKSKQTSQRNTKKQQRAYRTTVFTQSKKSQPYSIYQTKNMHTIQTDQLIEQKMQQSDDDFYSCTLRTESKVFIEGMVQSSEVEELEQAKSNQQGDGDKVMSSKKSRYNRQIKENDKGKEMNLVLENVKNKNYDMSLNLSDLGHRDYDNNQKKASLKFNKKVSFVELERKFNDLSDGSIEKDQREYSQRVNNQSIVTL